MSKSLSILFGAVCLLLLAFVVGVVSNMVSVGFVTGFQMSIWQAALVGVINTIVVSIFQQALKFVGTAAKKQ